MKLKIGPLPHFPSFSFLIEKRNPLEIMFEFCFTDTYWTKALNPLQFWCSSDHQIVILLEWCWDSKPDFSSLDPEEKELEDVLRTWF